MLSIAIETACRAGYWHVQTAAGAKSLIPWLCHWPADEASRGWAFDPKTPAIICSADAEYHRLAAVYPVTA